MFQKQNIIVFIYRTGIEIRPFRDFLPWREKKDSRKTLPLRKKGLNRTGIIGVDFKEIEVF
ncbi:MAG: hypothetical protein OXM55_03860 [Bdellovibrionales bacterium]|nr:hypothetical protein [Bdellovibrionales bacterium]